MKVRFLTQTSIYFGILPRNFRCVSFHDYFVANNHEPQKFFWGGGVLQLRKSPEIF
jgi:hypothetical protein